MKRKSRNAAILEIDPAGYPGVEFIDTEMSGANPKRDAAGGGILSYMGISSLLD